MRKKLKILAVTLLLTVLLLPTKGFAADTSVSISGGTSVKAGETVTVTVAYQGDALGYVDGALDYDTNRLEYISGGSSQGDGGIVQLKSWSDDASGSITFSLKFKGVDGGKTNLRLTTYETQDLDGNAMGTPSISRAMTVSGSGQAESSAAEETTGETAATEETTADTEQEASSASEERATIEETQPGDGEDPVAETTEPEAEIEKEGIASLFLPILAAISLVLILLIIVLLKKKK